MSEDQKVQELELSDETKAAMEHALVTVMQNFASELLNVFSVASASMQNKIIEAASKRSESQPTE